MRPCPTFQGSRFKLNSAMVCNTCDETRICVCARQKTVMLEHYQNTTLIGAQQNNSYRRTAQTTTGIRAPLRSTKAILLAQHRNNHTGAPHTQTCWCTIKTHMNRYWYLGHASISLQLLQMPNDNPSKFASCHCHKNRW